MITYKDLLKEAKMNFKPFIKHPTPVRYILAKKLFMKCQIRKDLFWSTDIIRDGLGDFVGLRLNSNFFRRPEVKKQIEAAKTKV